MFYRTIFLGVTGLGNWETDLSMNKKKLFIIEPVVEGILQVSSLIGYEIVYIMKY